MRSLPDVTTALSTRSDGRRWGRTSSFTTRSPGNRSRDPRRSRRPRSTAASGIADQATSDPGRVLHFDSIRYETNPHQAFYIDSRKVPGTGREEDGGNRGYKTAYKGGYFPVPPQTLRRPPQHHVRQSGPGRAGGGAGPSRSAPPAGGDQLPVPTLLQSADQVQLFKYHVKNTAWAHGKTVTHAQVVVRRQRPACTPPELVPQWRATVLRRTGYAGLSDIARWHRRAAAARLLALTTPTVNQPAAGAGLRSAGQLVYSQRNRSACIRIPVTGANQATRTEFGCGSSANPYLAFSPC